MTDLAHESAAATTSPAEPTPPGDGSSDHGGRGLALALGCIRLGPGLVLLLLCVVMAILSPFFLTERNLQNLGTQTSIIAVLAIGQLLVIVSRGVDVSVGSTVAFSAVVGAVLVDPGGNGLLMVAVILAAGAAVGIVNGGLIVKGGLPQPLIVTVAMLGVVRGLAQIFSDGTPIVGLPPLISDITSGFVGPVPLPVVLVVSLAVLFWVFSEHTQWGRWVYAVGGNPEAATRLGIPEGRVVFSVYVLSGLMAGIAGLLVAGRTDSATPLAGTTLELDVISAAIIGGASLLGGRGSVPGVLVGALVLGVIRNGLNLLDVAPFYQVVAIGVIVLVALELDVVRSRLENRVRVSQAEKRHV